MELIKITQGTPDWLEFRRDKVTATDISIINGTNKFNGNSPFKLWQQKLGLIEPDQTNEKMLEGRILEEEARLDFNDETFNFQPVVIVGDNPFFMASLDGYDKDQNFLLEIKCGEKAFNDAIDGMIAPYIYDQVQWQMYVTGYKKICIYFYRNYARGIKSFVEYNEQYVDGLVKKAEEFLKCLKDKKAPSMSELDENGDEEANMLAKDYFEKQFVAKKCKEEADLAREKLLLFCKSKETHFTKARIKVLKVEAKGIVDYGEFLKANGFTNADTEKFKKAGSISYRISELKD